MIPAPASVAATELATAMPRLLCPWKITGTVSTALTIAVIRAVTSGGRKWPAESVPQRLAHRREHLVVAHRGLPDLQRRRAETVAVADLHHWDPGRVGRLRVPAQRDRAELVPDRVLAVAQRRVVD